MSLSEWYYLPIAALINSLFTFFWQKHLGHKVIKGLSLWTLVFIGSLFNAWGMDVLQRLVEVVSLTHMLQISLGCWLFIVVATTAKHHALNGWSKKVFWIDYAGDLIGFILMGLIIYALT